MTAFLVLKVGQLLRKPTVRLQNLKLKTAGTVGLSGWVVGGVATLWLVFAAHSGLMQWDRHRGRQYLDRTEASREDVINGSFRHRAYTEQHDLATERSFKHFARADRFGLFGVVEVKLGMAWGYLLNDDLDAAIAAVQEAIAIAPDNANLHEQLIELLTARERVPELVEALRDKFEQIDSTAAERFEVAGMLIGLGRPEDAVEHYRVCVEQAPNSVEARYNLGGLLRRLERPAEAIEQLEIARQLAPTDPDTLVELGLALVATGDGVTAAAHFARAIELAPDSPEAQYMLPDLIQQIQGLPAQSPTE
jgi:tetratricopeptide (TPR) repeat protein